MTKYRCFDVHSRVLMSVLEFQKRVLFLLSDIRETLQTFGTRHDSDISVRLEQMDTIQQLHDFERDLIADHTKHQLVVCIAGCFFSLIILCNVHILNNYRQLFQHAHLLLIPYTDRALKPGRRIATKNQPL